LGQRVEPRLDRDQAHRMAVGTVGIGAVAQGGAEHLLKDQHHARFKGQGRVVHQRRLQRAPAQAEGGVAPGMQADAIVRGLQAQCV
jgi:hypothetical protein